MNSTPIRIATISLIATVGLLALKLALGLISGSIAVLSDAVDSGTDLAGGTAKIDVGDHSIMDRVAQAV